MIFFLSHENVLLLKALCFKISLDISNYIVEVKIRWTLSKKSQ